MQILFPMHFHGKDRHPTPVGCRILLTAGRMIFAMLFLMTTMSAHALSRYERKGIKLQKEGDYYEAIKMFAKTFSKKDSSVIGIEGTAQCYLALRNYDKAEYWFAKRMARPNPQNFVPQYVQSLVYSQKYELAKSVMENNVYFEGRDALLSACDSAQKWLDEKEPEYIVRNIYTLNSPYDDFAALPLGVGKNPFLFCSNRPDINTKTAKSSAPKSRNKSNSVYADNQLPSEFTRIWEAEAIYPENKPKNIDTIYKPTKDFRPAALASLDILNSKNANNGPIAYTKPSVIYFSRSSNKKSKNNQKSEYNLEIYSLPYVLNNTNAKITSFANNNSKEYSVTHPCISPDGKILYFVSDRPGGAGGKDIWFCEQDSKKGSWGAPKNCGNVINTPADEVFPTMDSEGILYFSSNGHTGMGGLDIFMAKGSKDKWERPVNMHTPINSGGDDFYLIKTGDNMRGYFSSNRTNPDIDGRQPMGGDDIYTFAPREELHEPYPLEIPVPAEYAQPYIPPISMVNLGKQPLFPPSLFVQEETPKRTPKRVPDTTINTTILLCEAVNEKTQNGIEYVKICVSQKDSSSLYSKCNYTGKDGKTAFALILKKKYEITAFKKDYKETMGMPLLMRTEQIIPNTPLKIIMREQAAKDIDDIDKYIDKYAKHKKFKSAVKRGQTEYRIQVLAIDKKSKRPLSYFDKIKNKFPKLYPPQRYTDGQFKHYTCGSFARYQTAKIYLKRLETLGYGKDNPRDKCFVAEYVNGKPKNKQHTTNSKKNTNSKTKKKKKK